jgi:hypothetical protein
MWLTVIAWFIWCAGISVYACYCQVWSWWVSAEDCQLCTYRECVDFRQLMFIIDSDYIVIGHAVLQLMVVESTTEMFCTYTAISVQW